MDWRCIAFLLPFICCLFILASHLLCTIVLFVVVLTRLYHQTVFDSQFDPMKHGYFEIGPICISDADTHTIRPDTYPIRQISFYYFQFCATMLRGYVRIQKGYGRDKRGSISFIFWNVGGYFAFVFSLL